ncbi:MAG: translational GTPase TypA [Bacilli bacterium]|nr:translational GTPase TypA [Bacilli bacterium]
MEIRNIAIIAHVDHGKTTLVDQLLKQSGTFRTNEVVEDRVMDSNDIERERGITILAKPTAINYKDYKINILDTPGHADFGGEVERIMKMVDGVLLVVDAYEGTMPQTRFVLKKALEANVKPIVVINKVDRPNTRVHEVIDEVYELFMDLDATDEQIDFPIVFASGLKGTSSYEEDLETQKETMEPIYETIIKYIPAPSMDSSSPLQFQPALLDYNDYVGRIGVGRVARGTIKVNQTVTCMRLDGTNKQFRIQKLFGFSGLKRVEVESVSAGDICAIAGLEDIGVGETVCETGCLEALPPLRIDEPTLEMTFSTNNSPFAGQEGKNVTARKIEERLAKESQRDVSLRFTRIPNTESWLVKGRGELHLSILIENMRREDFELQVSKPQVITKEIDGIICEPYEDLQVECPDESIGGVIEALGTRGAIMENMTSNNGQTRVNYVIPSRGLIGFSTDFMTLTKGYGIINHTYKEYRARENVSVGERKNGVLVAANAGKATAYGIGQVEDRGVMFVEPGTEVYEGMLVGENAYENDLAVNVAKAKNLSNMRSSSKDTTVVLKKPRRFSLESCLDYINEDELVEITPSTFRMRKKILNEVERKKQRIKEANSYNN